jgi:hypothetical protein
MKTIHTIFLALPFISITTQASLVNDKITLKPNMMLEYKQTPSSVDSLSEVFSKGMVYGRLRSNMFLWEWDDPSIRDNKAMGVGGSIIYKTAPFSGLSGTVGLYTTQNPAWFREDASDVSSVKAGKDTFSRYRVSASGKYGMTVLGQAYLQYDFDKTSIIAGRQIFESLYTKSNDTKMIPNTFDGVSVTTKKLPSTKVRAAYFVKHKLRDHTKSHDVIAFGGGSSPDKWSQNDDAGVNKNLTVARIGDDNKFIIFDLENKSIDNLKIKLNYASVPDVVRNVTVESHYTVPLTQEWKLVPGFRYMEQFDELGANYGVANLAADQSGYTNPNSLDTNLLGLRVDLKNSAFLGRIGYTKIADEADILTPWRGFPTGGFSRAMAQYNWYANTETYMLRAGYDFDKAGVLDGFSMMARYAIQDFDDNKPGVQADSDIIHVDMYQNLSRNLQAKVRVGLVDADVKDSGKSDVSYNEYRFELNYFF